MGLRYVATNVAKNLAAPAVLPLVRSRGSLGMDGCLTFVLDTLNEFGRSLSEIDIDIDIERVERVVELGPGRTPQVAAAFVLGGASSVTALDVGLSIGPAASIAGPYADLAEALLGAEAAAFRTGMGTNPGLIRQRFSRFAADSLPVCFERYDGRRLPLATSSIDLIVSKTVLEHVRLKDVPCLVGEMRRVLRPGGRMVHLIDLRDHMHIQGHEVKGDWLDALRYPEPLFRAMFSNRSTSINRLRAGQWRDLFEGAGFEVALWKPRTYPLPTTFRHDLVAPACRSDDDEDFSIGQLVIGLRVA